MPPRKRPKQSAAAALASPEAAGPHDDSEVRTPMLARCTLARAMLLEIWGSNHACACSFAAEAAASGGAQGVGQDPEGHLFRAGQRQRQQQDGGRPPDLGLGRHHAAGLHRQGAHVGGDSRAVPGPLDHQRRLVCTDPGSTPPPPHTHRLPALPQLPVTHAKEKAVLASQHETRFPELWQRWRCGSLGCWGWCRVGGGGGPSRGDSLGRSGVQVGVPLLIAAAPPAAPRPPRSAGYSLLFYGYGSKRELLLQLGRSWTSDGACFAVEGQQPGLTARDVLVWAAAAAHGAKPAAYRAYSADDLLELLRRPDAARVYVIVHGIDGPGLRDPGAQAQLSRLAALPRCHLAASVDHVNAALLWSLQARDRFAWTWVHAPTLRPLTREVTAAGIPPLLLGRREEGAARGARVVLASLSRNARQVFRLLATCQLAPDGEHGEAVGVQSMTSGAWGPQGAPT